MAEATPRPSMKKQSPGAHELAKDVDAARVDLGNARKMTSAGCDPFGQ